jgi:hypothetical protein
MPHLNIVEGRVCSARRRDHSGDDGNKEKNSARDMHRKAYRED